MNLWGDSDKGARPGSLVWPREWKSVIHATIQRGALLVWFSKKAGFSLVLDVGEKNHDGLTHADVVDLQTGQKKHEILDERWIVYRGDAIGGGDPESLSGLDDSFAAKVKTGIQEGRPSVELTAPYGGGARQSYFHPDLRILADAGFTLVETPIGAVVYLPGCSDPERYA